MFPVASSIYYRLPAAVVDALPPPPLPYDAASLHAAAAGERRKVAPLSLPVVGRLPVASPLCYQTAAAASTPSPDADQIAWTTPAAPGSDGTPSHPGNAPSPPAADDVTSSPVTSSPSPTSSLQQPDDVVKPTTPTLKFGVTAILSPDFASRARPSTIAYTRHRH